MLRRDTTKGKGKGAREAQPSRSVGGEPSGDEGVLLVHRAAEEAARIWSVDGCVPEDAVSIRTKAAKGRPVRKLLGAVVSSDSDTRKATAAVSAAEVAGGVDDEEKHAADVASAEADRKEGRKLRLSEECVNSILSLKPMFDVDPDEEYARMMNHPDDYSQEFIEESVELFRDQAESSKLIFARFEKLQAWMRSELEEKGYVEVEVDDHYIAQRVLCRVAAEAGVEEWIDAFGPVDGREGFQAYQG